MSKEYLTYENKILGQEIERLAKEVEKLEKVNQMLLNSMVTEAHTKETKEIERLNNIINELEEEYINYMDKQDFAKKCKISRPYLDKLLKGMNRKEIYEFCKQRNKIKELKGSDKE